MENVKNVVIDTVQSKRIGKHRTASKNAPVYLALDSDFLRHLANYILFTGEDQEKINAYKDVANNIEEVRYFKTLLDENLIKVVVLPTVLRECSTNVNASEFIAKYGLIPKRPN